MARILNLSSLGQWLLLYHTYFIQIQHLQSNYDPTKIIAKAIKLYDKTIQPSIQILFLMSIIKESIIAYKLPIQQLQKESLRACNCILTPETETRHDFGFPCCFCSLSLKGYCTTNGNELGPNCKQYRLQK